MTHVSFSRVFAMSAFEGLRTLRLNSVTYPNMDIVALSEFITRVDASSGAHDYEAAFALDPLVIARASPTQALDFYQECIEALIPAYRPVWVRTIPLGRSKFVQKLSRDEVQCFRSAGLLDEPPTIEIINWWDRVAARARLQADQEKMIRAREAERLSLEHETRRLARLGINSSPIWMSIEDNTAGYDIRSFDPGTDQPVARLIEVKSTIASPLRFFVSRNEWETALKYGPAYFFHVWDLRGPQLHQRTVADILPHIPTDNEQGKWQNATIHISSN